MSEALAQVLGADRGEHSVEAAATAIAAYISGRSSRMAQRESGVPERTIDRWVEQLGIERTPRETAKIKTAALEAGRVKSADVRRTLGAL